MRGTIHISQMKIADHFSMLHILGGLCRPEHRIILCLPCITAQSGMPALARVALPEMQVHASVPVCKVNLARLAAGGQRDMHTMRYVSQKPNELDAGLSIDELMPAEKISTAWH